jgi:hypothetical protein
LLKLLPGRLLLRLPLLTLGRGAALLLVQLFLGGASLGLVVLFQARLERGPLGFRSAVGILGDTGRFRQRALQGFYPRPELVSLLVLGLALGVRPVAFGADGFQLLGEGVQALADGGIPLGLYLKLLERDLQPVPFGAGGGKLLRSGIGLSTHRGPGRLLFRMEAADFRKLGLNLTFQLRCPGSLCLKFLHLGFELLALGPGRLQLPPQGNCFLLRLLKLGNLGLEALQFLPCAGEVAVSLLELVRNRVTLRGAGR